MKKFELLLIMFKVFMLYHHAFLFEKRRFRYLFAGILLSIVIFKVPLFAQNNSTESLNASKKDVNESRDSEADLIHFGDLVEIDVVGSSEFDWRGTLNSDGFLESFTFSEEPIYGLCKSEDEVFQNVTKSYTKFLREPVIEVKILDRSNRPIAILSGAVRTPQRFQIKRTILLNELLIISGGMTDKSSGEIQIFRPRELNCLAAVADKTAASNNNPETRDRFIATRQDNGAQFINIKISELLSGDDLSNPQILSGDIVTVLESQPIYVIGGVESPSQISMRSQMTLTRAIASAGGLSADSDSTKITVFRREGNETKVIHLNLLKIRALEEEDLILQVFDIVDVERKGSADQRIPTFPEDMYRVTEDKLKLPLRVID